MIPIKIEKNLEATVEEMRNLHLFIEKYTL